MISLINGLIKIMKALDSCEYFLVASVNNELFDLSLHLSMLLFSSLILLMNLIFDSNFHQPQSFLYNCGFHAF